MSEPLVMPETIAELVCILSSKLLKWVQDTSAEVVTLRAQVAEQKDSVKEARNELQRVLAKECCADEIEALKRDLADSKAETKLLWTALADAVPIERVNALSAAVLLVRKGKESHD